MKIAITAVIFISICLSGCSKETPEPPLTVEVIDYVTNQPVEHAEVVKSLSHFDLTCLCFTSYRDVSFGFTNLSGKLRIMSFQGLEVRKENYYTGWQYRHAYFEMNQDTAKVHLFKKGLFDIIPVPSQPYPSSQVYLEIHPVLRDGSVPTAGGSRFSFPGNSFTAGGFGNIKNRILALKVGTGSIPDTLSKIEIFLPANTTLQITIPY